MTQTLLPLATLAASFLTLFGSAEWMYHSQRLQAEWSRKFVHIVTGLITLLFPILLSSHWQVLVLSIAFGVILLASKRLNLLPSINGITRPSHGSILYPISVYLAFVVFDLKGDSALWFYAPILALALCDPLAAWVGKHHPWKPYAVGSETKTMSGSLAFFAAAFVLLYGLLQGFQADMIVPIPLAALLLSLVATFSEGVSRKGTDNLWIPLSVLLGMELLGVMVP